MKKILLTAAALLAVSAAHADYRPIVNDRYFTTTAELNGGVQSAISPFSSSVTYTVASELVANSRRLETLLNASMDASFREKGGTLGSGTLTGPFRIVLSPTGTGQTAFAMSGANYVANGTVSGSYLGVSYTCYVNIRLNNLQAFATFNNASTIVDGSGSTTYSRDVSASCTTSISWLPVFDAIADTFADRWAAARANGQIDTYARELVNGLFARPNGLPSGLDKIGAAVGAVTQANGVTVGVAQVLHYLDDRQGVIDMTLGTFAPIANKSGVVEPSSNRIVGQLLDFKFTHPQVGNYRMGLTDTAVVTWQYVCPLGSKTCWIP
ncbi:hypothetical protein [Roseateles sp.]|uniref:hypothetical protein n=1 Tax=Roseateles sp. TaxID=1971397 RepID=UPI002F4146F5